MPSPVNPLASLSRNTPDTPDTPDTRTLLIGTGLSVAQLHHNLEAVSSPPQVIGCLLPAQAAYTAELDCPILGDLQQLAHQLDTSQPDLVLVCLPLSMGKQISELAGILDHHGVIWRYMPTLSDLLAGRTYSQATGGTPTPTASLHHQAIDPAQLIDRKPRPLDEQAIARTLTERVVLITGAGGSIGSELARIVSRFDPARLILIDRSENGLFQIDCELARAYPDLNHSVVLHDITQADRTADLLIRLKPDIIFHAAAHKHVPMMEDHPAEAVENNFYGTRSIADAAAAAGADRFVMISSDKAVNPSSVMGATKRLAELYVQWLNSRTGATPGSRTIYSMVRFGNVLGSACSVLPIWTEQLAHGGPITVTHPDMHRYFMTIPEAAGLVLQAGALSQGGEVFLLDMGKPIRILDLARRFLLGQGFEPDVDVPLQITGIRPGEKLFEVLAYESEDMNLTEHQSIRIWLTSPPDASHMRQIINTFDRLRDKSSDGSRRWRDATSDAVVNALRSAIPEMVRSAAG